MNKFLKRILSLILMLVLGLWLGGCTNNDEYSDVSSDEPSDPSIEGVGSEVLTSVDDLVADIQVRFAREDHYDFIEPLIDVPRDHMFTFDLTPEAVEIFSEISGLEDGFQVSDVLRIYRDSAFTQSVSFLADGDTENFTYLTISPFRHPVFPVSDPAVGGNLFPQGEWNDWGNANQYFLVKYFDLTTGEELERPQVTVFNIATEIPGAPRVKFNLNEEGMAGLVWEPIPGAEEYAVVKVREHQDGRSTQRRVDLLHRTSNTYWRDVHTAAGRENRSFNLAQGNDNIDAAFDYHMNHEDGSDWTLEEFIMQDWNFEAERNTDYNWYLAVIALNTEGTSAISNLVDIRSVSSQVPISVARHLNEGALRPTGIESNSRGDVEHDVLLAPSHAWVIMADGTAAQHLINYDIGMAREQSQLTGLFEADEGGNLAYDDDGNLIIEDIEETPTLIIPYHIEGTNFRGFVQVVEHNEETFEAELGELVARQDGLRSRTGDIARTVDLNAEVGDKANAETASELRNDFEVRASSPLSAYLALQMLNGQTRISLDDFPEAADHEYLVDAWFEAVLQNPLVLGARSFQLDRATGDIFVTYDQDAATQQRQQQAILARVDEIVEEIIFEGMTDLEMQTAINHFLIENATYDFGALENAELNNFMFVDPEYYDSFTAYGILINGVGVCSGYADAFTLIADRAGLESVIVTGFLQGSLPHAWNRVNIDGNWYTLDVTNNDNEFFPNAFFNLSDHEASFILTEDTQWILDRELPQFTAKSVANSEYYRYNNRFFDQDEIIDALVAGIRQNGTATYRTDVMLTADEFEAIAGAVAEQLGNRDLFGGFFLGIIYIAE